MTAITIDKPGFDQSAGTPLLRRAARRHDADRDQELGDGEHDVGAPGERRVGPAAEEAGKDADRVPIEHCEARGDDAHKQRRSRPVHRAHEEIPARGVGAEPELGVRPSRQAEVVRHVRERLVLPMPGDVLRERAAEDGEEDEHDDDDPSG